jgi:hypothetical protein
LLLLLLLLHVPAKMGILQAWPLLLVFMGVLHLALAWCARQASQDCAPDVAIGVMV